MDVVVDVVRDDGRVSPEPNDPPDPFRTDVPGHRAGDQPPSEGAAGPGEPRRGPSDGPAGEPDDTASRAQAIRLAVVAVVAVAASFVAPPVGGVLGLVAIVRAVRSRGTVPTRVRGLAIAAGALAAVVGVVATTLLLLFRVEVGDYRECLAGANTQQARDNCTAALNYALTSRLGLTTDR
jgi:hypothetical protein